MFASIRPILMPTTMSWAMEINCSHITIQMCFSIDSDYNFSWLEHNLLLLILLLKPCHQMPFKRCFYLGLRLFSKSSCFSAERCAYALTWIFIRKTFSRCEWMNESGNCLTRAVNIFNSLGLHHLVPTTSTMWTPRCFYYFIVCTHVCWANSWTILHLNAIKIKKITTTKQEEWSRLWLNTSAIHLTIRIAEIDNTKSN